MRKRNFNRFLILAFCLVFCFTLTAPAFAAADDLGYQYVFTQEFDFSEMIRDPSSGWYFINFDLRSIADQVRASAVVFSVDDYSWKVNFKTSYRGVTHNYIGNAYSMRGIGSPSDLPFLLMICAENNADNILAFEPDFFGMLTHGDTQKVHVAMSVAYHEPPAPSDLLSVFSTIGNRIMSLLASMTSLFWSVSPNGTGSLTFLGIVSLVSLGISVVFLLMKVVSRFMHFSG